ncbi:hypothetical protein ACWGKU_31000 [Kitasatospora sp. NPDC054768]
MTTILNTLNQWTRRRRWAVTGMFTVVLAAVLAVLNTVGFSDKLWASVVVLPALAAHGLRLLSPAISRLAQRLYELAPMLLWTLSLTWVLYQTWHTRNDHRSGLGGAVAVTALVWWLWAARSHPTTGWRQSLSWRPRRAVAAHVLCMTLFVAGVYLQVRSTPTVTPTTRLTVGIGLFTAGVAFCFRAKTRTHKICTATKKAAEQLAGKCRALDGGAELDTEDLRQQIRDLDVLLATPLPTTVKLTGLPLLTQPERHALIHDHLLAPLTDPSSPCRWAEAAEDLETLASGVAGWADSAV